MSFTANTAFEARVSNNEWDKLCNVTGLYKVSDDPADCSAGTLCVTNGLLPCEGFAGIYNENAYIMNAATSDANIDTPIYACNPYESQMLQGGNNRYHIGHETLGLGINAGDTDTFTLVRFDNINVYRFGAGNADDATGTYFSIDGGFLKKEASAPTAAGSIYFEKVGSGYFTKGSRKSFAYIDVKACKVSVGS